MITGLVTDDGIPVIGLNVAGRRWDAIIDTGFNGDLELPDSMRAQADLKARFVGRATSLLAGGQEIEEDVYLVDFPFYDQIVLAQATFVVGDEILIGTRLLRPYRLEVNFLDQAVVIDSPASNQT